MKEGGGEQSRCAPGTDSRPSRRTGASGHLWGPVEKGADRDAGHLKRRDQAALTLVSRLRLWMATDRPGSCEAAVYSGLSAELTSNELYRHLSALDGDRPTRIVRGGARGSARTDTSLAQVRRRAQICRFISDQFVSRLARVNALAAFTFGTV